MSGRRAVGSEGRREIKAGTSRTSLGVDVGSQKAMNQ